MKNVKMKESKDSNQLLLILALLIISAIIIISGLWPINEKGLKCKNMTEDIY